MVWLLGSFTARISGKKTPTSLFLRLWISFKEVGKKERGGGVHYMRCYMMRWCMFSLVLLPESEVNTEYMSLQLILGALSNSTSFDFTPAVTHHSLASPWKRSLRRPGECEKCLCESIGSRNQWTFVYQDLYPAKPGQSLKRLNCIKNKRQKKRYPPEQLRLLRHEFLFPSSCTMFSSDTRVLITHHFLPLSRSGCFHSHGS